MQLSQIGNVYTQQSSTPLASGAKAAVRADTSAIQPVDGSGLAASAGQIIYERHQTSGRHAVSQYLHTQHAGQREAISQAVGIDTYA